MTVEAGFENVNTDSTEVKILKDTNVMSAILVGPRDFILRGRKSEIVKWLTTFNKPIKTCKGYGSHVNIILNPYLAPSSNRTRENTATQSRLSRDSTFKKGLRRITNTMNKNVEIRFSATEGNHHSEILSKNTSLSFVTVESNFTSRYTAAIVSLMK